MRDYLEYLRIPYSPLKQDCYGLIKLFYRQEYGINLPDLVYPVKLGSLDYDVIETNYLDAGFEKTLASDFSYGNIIVFGKNKLGVHLGVSLSDGTFLHTTIKGTARHSYINSEWSEQLLYTLKYRG